MDKQKRKRRGEELSNESKYKVHLINEATNILECKPFKQLIYLFIKCERELSKQEIIEKLKWSRVFIPIFHFIMELKLALKIFYLNLNVLNG